MRAIFQNFCLRQKLTYPFTQLHDYSQKQHSLLDKIYSYNYNDHYLGYLIIDDKTKSIIAIDPGDLEVAFNNVLMLRHKLQYNFTHIFQSHGKSLHTRHGKELHARFKGGLSVYAGDAGTSTTCFYTHLAQDLAPVIVGDLSVCFLKAPGHTEDNFIIAVTHVSETSTKVPVLFTGDTLQISSVGEISDYQAMFATLQRIRGFPGASLVFPGHRLRRENLLFMKTLDPGNSVINVKLQVLQEMEEKQTGSLLSLLPTTLMEERMGNPFLMLSDESIQKVLQEKDPIRCMQKLRLIQRSYF